MKKLQRNTLFSIFLFVLFAMPKATAQLQNAGVLNEPIDCTAKNFLTVSEKPIICVMN